MPHAAGLRSLDAFGLSRLLLWLTVWLAAMLTYDYYARIEAPELDKRAEMHRSIVAGEAAYQVRYRVLTPFAAEAVSRALHSLHVRERRALAVAYLVLDFAALALMLAAMSELLTTLFSFEWAVAGLAISAVMIAFTFRDHFYHPWSLWEGAFYAVGLLLMLRGSTAPLILLIVLACVNRETSIFLPLMWMAYALPRWRSAAAGLAAWAITYFALHWTIGYRPATFFLSTAIAGNRKMLDYAVLLNLLLIGGIVPLIVRGILRGPHLIRRTAMVSPLYLGLLLAIGFWWEVRYWITLLPVIVPALIAGISQANGRDRATEMPRTSLPSTLETAQ